MNRYISAIDMPGNTDSEKIQNAVQKAKEEGVNQVLIPKRDRAWMIDKTIVLPSDIEILADGAHLRLADDTYINLFATENYMERDTTKVQKNIEIHGINGALFDGGNYNGLSEFNSLQDGRPHISQNTLMMFYLTEHLYVHDIKVINQRWWGITNVFVTDSVFQNIEFKADLSRIDERGVHHPDQLPQCYNEVYVKNADGIDLRVGCSNITIENITGFTEDDTIALTAIAGPSSFEYPLLPEGKSTDIHHVTIKNIASDCYVCSNVRLLCANGRKVHDILIDGVKDTRTNPHYKSKGTVRIGDVAYGRQLAGKGDMCRITVRNVESKSYMGVSVCKPLWDAVIENVRTAPGGTSFGVLCDAELDRVSVSHIENEMDSYYL